MADLFQLLKYSRSGYELAYDRAQDPRLRDLFGALASGRILMLADLERATAARRKRNIPGFRFVQASLQKAWVDMLNALQLIGDQSLLAECARGERYIIRIYERYGEIQGIDPVISELLQRHRAIMNGNLADIDLLRKTTHLMA